MLLPSTLQSLGLSYQTINIVEIILYRRVLGSRSPDGCCDASSNPRLVSWSPVVWSVQPAYIHRMSLHQYDTSELDQADVRKVHSASSDLLGKTDLPTLSPRFFLLARDLEWMLKLRSAILWCIVHTHTMLCVQILGTPALTTLGLDKVVRSTE